MFVGRAIFYLVVVVNAQIGHGMFAQLIHLRLPTVTCKSPRRHVILHLHGHARGENPRKHMSLN